MHTSDTLVISTQGLSKTYKGVNALQPLDLQVARHAIFGFLGPNGAGKSTTIKLEHPRRRDRDLDRAVSRSGAVAVWPRGVLDQ